MIPFCISILLQKRFPAGIHRLMLLATINMTETAVLSVFLEDDAYAEAPLIFNL